MLNVMGALLGVFVWNLAQSVLGDRERA